MDYIYVGGNGSPVEFNNVYPECKINHRTEKKNFKEHKSVISDAPNIISTLENDSTLSDTENESFSDNDSESLLDSSDKSSSGEQNKLKQCLTLSDSEDESFNDNENNKLNNLKQDLTLSNSSDGNSSEVIESNKQQSFMSIGKQNKNSSELDFRNVNLSEKSDNHDLHNTFGIAHLNNSKSYKTDKFKCKYCLKKYAQKFNLIRHYACCKFMKMSNIANSAALKCASCHKNFTTKRSLKRHIKMY